jgi:pimeloyl-ACP methyl ester carboxylesterase
VFNYRFHKAALLTSLVSLVLLLSNHASAYEKFSNPVIFIHGIIGDITTWQDFGEILGQNKEQNQLTFGGCITFNKDAGAADVIFTPDICKSTTYPLSSGDFYLMQFSDNQNLTFHDQAKELEAIINTVSAANGQAKVILVAYSMGGLAARSYLQFISPTADKVLKLITVGTPHQGADITHLCESTPICTAFEIHLGSRAVAELDPTTSSALKDLNDLIRHPLPTRVSYTSIIGIGTFVIGDGDGIVSASSQNLGKVIEMNVGVHLHHTAKSINVAKCYLTEAWPEVHTCEPSDTKILTEVLNQIYECDTLNSGDLVPIGYGASYNIFSLQQELLLSAFCTLSTTRISAGNGNTGDPAQNYFGRQLVYRQGYEWDGNQWRQINLQCTGETESGIWCVGGATTLPGSNGEILGAKG